MTTFETQIFNCGKCNEKLFYFELTSFYIIESESYSDGYMDSSPPLPSFNQVVICPNCQHIEWKDDIINEEGNNIEDCIQCTGLDDIMRSFEIRPNLKMAGYYMDLINSGFADSVDREVSIRIEIWRTLNNSIRYSDHVKTGPSGILKKAQSVFGGNSVIFSEEEYNIYKPNLQRLTTLFKPEYYEQELLLADMYRELGEFDMALNVLENTAQSDRNSFFNQIKSAVRKRNEKVIKLN